MVSVSEQITRHIKETGGWRGAMLARIRKVIQSADPALVEEWKWNTPVWSYNGNVVAVGVFADHVKINFFKGASLADPKHLFNAGLEAKATRAIDISEGVSLDEAALKSLVKAAVALNGEKSTSSRKGKATSRLRRVATPQVPNIRRCWDARTRASTGALRVSRLQPRLTSSAIP